MSFRTCLTFHPRTGIIPLESLGWSLLAGLLRLASWPKHEASIFTKLNTLRVTFVPVEEQKIMDIFHAPIKSPTGSQDIAIYEQGKHYCLYIRSVVVLQSVSKAQRRHWAARLISELIKEIANLGANGIIIDKIYAQTDTKHVEHLLKILGFNQIVSPTEKKNFILDIATSGSVFAMQYKKVLNLWLDE